MDRRPSHANSVYVVAWILAFFSFVNYMSEKQRAVRVVTREVSLHYACFFRRLCIRFPCSIVDVVYVERDYGDCKMDQLTAAFILDWDDCNPDFLMTKQERDKDELQFFSHRNLGETCSNAWLHKVCAVPFDVSTAKLTCTKEWH